MNGRHHRWRRLGAPWPSEIHFSYKREPPQWALHLRSLCATGPDCKKVARIRLKDVGENCVYRFCPEHARYYAQKLGYKVLSRYSRALQIDPTRVTKNRLHRYTDEQLQSLESFGNVLSRNEARLVERELRRRRIS